MEYAIDESATAEDFSVVQMEGSREVTRTITCYSLEAIIAVGYRVIQDKKYVSDFDKEIKRIGNGKWIMKNHERECDKR